jgi:hypothetical protein
MSATRADNFCQAGRPASGNPARARSPRAFAKSGFAKRAPLSLSYNETRTCDRLTTDFLRDSSPRLLRRGLRCKGKVFAGAQAERRDDRPGR